MSSDCEEPKDDFLEAVLRGEVPSELRTHFMSLTPLGLASLWTVVTMAVVEMVLDVRDAYAQSHPMASDNRPLVGSLARHMKKYMSQAHAENSELSGDERTAQRSLLLSMLDSTYKLLGKVEEEGGDS